MGFEKEYMKNQIDIFLIAIDEFMNGWP